MKQHPTHPGHTNRRVPTSLGLAASGLLMAAVAFSGAAPAYAAEAKVNLATVGAFSVIAGSTVTNTGPSVLGADLGVSPGTAITGFPPGTALGATHANDAVALQAQSDLTTAYNDAAGRSMTGAVSADLAGQTLTSGVYTASTSMGLSGDLTLDAQGDPNAVFIFQAGSTLTTGSNSKVTLINGALPCNVYWQVGSSATLGTGTDFVGTVMALTSATLNTGADVEGRILARNGAVTLDTNVITAPNCTPPVIPPPSPAAPAPTTGTPSGTPTTSPIVAPTTTPSTTPSGSPSATPAATPTASPTKNPTAKPTPTPTPGTPTTPTPTPPSSTTTPPFVPEGHPPTGLGGAEDQEGAPITFLLLLAGLAGAGAIAASTLGSRRG